MRKGKPVNPFQIFLSGRETYRPNEISKLLDVIEPYFDCITSNKRITYYNAPCAFDIETSSFRLPPQKKGDDGEKVAIMYEWTFGIYGAIVIGRTWEEFTQMMGVIVSRLRLCEYRRLVCYVHNLSFEFQFLRKHFKWSKVFSMETRKPIYAITDTGIEYRCSYMLSRYSLAKLGEQLHNYKVSKMVGDLDYDLIRHSKTLLTDTELLYCINDARVVMAYIQEQIEQYGDITKIPLTNTGRVRTYCRNNCFYDDGVSRKKSNKRRRYKDIIDTLTLDTETYKQLKRAFQGGFTHANPFYVGNVINDVTSLDFTSSYPTVMVSEKFPMSAPERVIISTPEEFTNNINKYCCLFDVTFTGLKPRILYDNYISISRCWGVLRPVVSNGRIVSADKLSTTVTEQDYKIIKMFYEWDNIKISNFCRFRRGYLPTDFVKSILTLYGNKTKLKGVSGKEVEYLNSKEMINACYGMTVTDIVRDNITYTDEWGAESVNVDETISKYNKDRARFLYYPWGVWVTAYARANLFTGITEFKNDYLYADTDSVKVKNVDKHNEYIQKYNKYIIEKLYKAVDYHGISRSMIAPETIKGVSKQLGVWDFDGHYSRFKTLGAKRYMVEYSNDARNDEKLIGKVNITVAGLNKGATVPYLIKKYGDDVFSHFENDLKIPAENTGKLTHTYIDIEVYGTVTDYTGVTADYRELSGVHLEPAEYCLSMSEDFINYITGVQYTD